MWKPVRRLLKIVEYVVGRNYYECKRLGSGEYNQQCGKYSDGFRCVRCPIFREGLTSILAKSSFKPVWSALSTEDVRATVGGLRKQVLVLIGVRDGDNLGEALSAAKARLPDGHVVVVGDSRKRELVTTAVASEATRFVDENVATSTLIKQLELIAQGEPIISVLLFKRLLGNGSAPPSVEAV
jgi:DNA-binding NarL/FixJ family response regulator